MSTAFSVSPRMYASYAEFNSWTGQGFAVSPEAQSVSSTADTIRETIEDSRALYGSKSDSLLQLNAIAIECSETNWDGYGAKAADDTAVQVAKCFIRALPDNFPLPEFAVEPDGSISMDWMSSPSRIFSVSAGRSNRLACAWAKGSARGHAVEVFDGMPIPRLILDGIRDITLGHSFIGG